jgi:hypothetical protein
MNKDWLDLLALLGLLEKNFVITILEIRALDAKRDHPNAQKKRHFKFFTGALNAAKLKFAGPAPIPIKLYNGLILLMSFPLFM